MTLDAGTRLGRYEIRSLLGSGGMGEVYLAYDCDLEREVAVKVLRDGTASSDRTRRFVQEAKAASGLHHPNVAHVYEIGSQDDMRFIAMEVVAGETLRDRLSGGPLSVADTLHIATQIAAALAAAHKQNIVHRDIKPENVIITPDGYVKVLDFGLAKLREIRGEDAATLLKTKSGIAMGTLGYMPPEQIGGDDITAAADVFSLGVVMYEMLSGRRPFTGNSATEVVSAILSKTPLALHGVPPPLRSIISKCLAKDPSLRYSNAGELHDELRGIANIAPVPKKNRSWIWIAAVVVALIIVAAAISMAMRAQRLRAALAQLTTAERMLKERKLPEAYDAVATAESELPGNDRVRDLLTKTSGHLTVESDPPGATVYLQRFKGPQERTRMGITPITISRAARADYLLTLEKGGYATAVRPISLLPTYLRGEAFQRETPPVRLRLIETSKVPPGMVFVQGAEYRLSASFRASDRAVKLQDFFIDRCEVSNREFEQFVREGGYRRRELWQSPFVDNGKTLTFEQAMARFRDSSGLPGPRSWNGGVPAAGRENLPVADVTWYEAAAFAAWKGKKLPTVYQWERAARYFATSEAVSLAFPWGLVGEGVDATERANFQGQGPMPVDSMPFGASPWGALHMAGNVSEWCRNQNPPGYAARGGSYKDAVYAFGQTAALPSFFAEPTLGFRCVSGASGDEGDFALNPSGFVPVFTPVDDKTFGEYRRRYEYKPEPLNANVIGRIETADWTRETITYVVAGKTVPAYLYLPKGFSRPLQAIHYAPAGDVVYGYRTLPHSIEVNLAPLIRSGRAVFSVELEGFLGRPHPPGWTYPDREQDEEVEYIVAQVTEMRRGLDYLETRPDIDHSRIALLGISAGGGPGVFVSALESRYRSVIFGGSGISTSELRYAPAASRVNFVSRITAPKLLFQGRYDEDTSLKSEAEPMFRLFREPKRLEIFEGGHIAPLDVSVRVFTRWLDETMGPVRN